MAEKPIEVTRKENFEYFLHQDKLLWSRLQTLGVIQLATIGGSYGLRETKWFAIGVLILGGILTVLVFNLLKRDEIVRDHVGKSIYFGYGSSRKWYAPFLGRELTWLFLVLLIFSDLLLGVMIYLDIFGQTP